MVKTKGATDLRKRKRRKDKGRRRKFYAGKKTKPKRKRHGRLVPYQSKRKKGDPLKVWFFEILPMSREGYRRWNKYMRPKLYKFVFVPVDKPFFAEPETISTPEQIGDLACSRIQYPGTFHFRMPTASRSSHRVSYKTKATIVIRETGDEEIIAKVQSYSKMKKYWFFKE